VQHHIQPLIEEVHKPEQHYHQTEPLSHEYGALALTLSPKSNELSPSIELTPFPHAEEQTNSEEDKAFFASLNKHRSSETHICEERQVIENGETVTTTIHYHVRSPLPSAPLSLTS
jgi:hypothetical protein